jgi:hypothetical protein
MKQTEVKKTLDELTEDIASIEDKKTASILNTLVNLVEVLVEDNSVLKKENQTLKDEVNRLKGEQGKPNIKGKNNNQNSDHSSEGERNKRQSEKSRKPKVRKKSSVRIDRQITCEFDKTELPDDAVFKGYQTRVIQDLKITTDNIQFKLKTYYSPSLKKTFVAPLPNGYKDEFGPSLKSIVIALYRDSGMTISAIERFLTTHNILISKSTISIMLTENNEEFYQEKEDIINAGLKSSLYQHIDDTGCRVNGENHYTHILCSPLFTAFFTRPKKDRLTLLSLLCREELKFAINNDAYELMVSFGLPAKRIAELKDLNLEPELTKKKMDDVLLQLFPNAKKHSSARRIIHESSAIVYYHSSESAIKFLMCDDAPQFNKIATHKILCWIHEGRHFKKLTPIFSQHRKSLDKFLDEFWDYYALLLSYKESPSEEESHKLMELFDQLFKTKTGYAALDDRISKTLAKRDYLLLVLDFPFLPLENNPAELGARVQARIRDINLQTISDNGTKSKDTFATIVQTARKLSVNIYDYIHDRVSERYKMKSLAEMIIEQSQLPT